MKESKKIAGLLALLVTAISSAFIVNAYAEETEAACFSCDAVYPGGGGPPVYGCAWINHAHGGSSCYLVSQPNGATLCYLEGIGSCNPKW